MIDEASGRTLRMGEAVDYRLIVDGDVSRGDLDRLGALRSTRVASPDGRMATELEGRVRDQAQLIGLLNGLYDMGLPILTVDRIK